MWDPRNYTDSDFGLDDDESFEPQELDDTHIDVAIEPHVMTVLGPVRPEDLGISQIGEIVLSDRPQSDPDLQLNDVSRAIEELTSFVTAGGKSIVDMTTPDQGRDLLGLLDLARRVPVHVICSTGAEVGATRMLQEIRDGVGPRRIRPGVIQVHEEGDALRSARDVSGSTGLPIYIHGSVASISGRLGVEQRHSTIVAVVSGGEVGSMWMRTMLESGVFIMLTGIGENISLDRQLARRLVELESDGFGDHLLVSQAVRRRSQLLAWGGNPGLVYLLERFTLELMEAGAGALFVRQLLVDNPGRVLTIAPPGGTVPT